MAQYSVVGTYSTMSAAEDAVRALLDDDFPLQQVSVIAQHLQDDRRVHGYVTSLDVARSSAAGGAWVGGIFGMLVGAGFMWVPGVGALVVAGSLAAVLLAGAEGAVAGAAVSGLLGWMFSLGISREKILKYEEAVKGGKFLVVAHGTEGEVNKARDVLAGTGAEHLDLHAPATG